MTRVTILKTHEHRALWIAAIMAAAAMLLTWASRTAGASDAPVRSPALALPSVVTGSADLPPAHGWQYHNPQLAAPGAQPAADLVMLVWTALDDHRRGDFEAALESWNSLQLAPDADVWRLVAIAQAHMALGQLDEAAMTLAEARDFDADNSAAHYYVGLLNLERAARAHDWYDAVGPATIRLAAYSPVDVSPNTRSMYRLAARQAFETAIREADAVRLDQPLTPSHWSSTIALGPSVGDLLIAIGADNFPAKAHNVLGNMLLEDGMLEAAEAHMDAAVAGGLNVGFGYDDLASAYADAQRPEDAARARIKAVAQRRGDEF